MSDQQKRERLRRMHIDEPVQLTNPLAHAASHLLRVVEEMTSEPGKTPMGDVQAQIAVAQVQASLALAQEVKNLRVAMYGESQ